MPFRLLPQQVPNDESKTSIALLLFLLCAVVSAETLEESAHWNPEEPYLVQEADHKRGPYAYSFGLGKKSVEESYLPEYSAESSPEDNHSAYEDTFQAELKRSERYPLDLEKPGSARYAFGLGKKDPRFAFGLGKKWDDLNRYAFGLGKRGEDMNRYGFGLGKRDELNRFAFGLGKRKPGDSRFNFGLGKRGDGTNRFAFGLGKRGRENRFGFGLGKRDDMNRFAFGLGKRDDMNRFAFGLGKREGDDRSRFAFGLGKRDEEEEGVDVSSSQEKRSRDSSRFAFGLGKKSDNSRFNFGLGKRDDAKGKRDGMNSDLEDFMKRRFSFGLGKRAPPNSTQNEAEIQHPAA